MFFLNHRFFKYCNYTGVLVKTKGKQKSKLKSVKSVRSSRSSVLGPILYIIKSSPVEPPTQGCIAVMLDPRAEISRCDHI